MELGENIIESEPFDTHVYKKCVKQLFRSIGVNDWPDMADDEITTIVSTYVGMNIRNQFDWQGSYEIR
jgi:hypothetical protein